MNKNVKNMHKSPDSVLRIGVLLPEVLGTYGDGGNAIVLQQRAVLRDIPAQIISLSLDQPIPADLDIYTLGGGEDSAQALAVEHLRRYDGLAKGLSRGAQLLAICAGMQVLGQWWQDSQDRQVAGLELLDVTTTAQGKRSIGELISVPLLAGLSAKLTGFENHGGATHLGPQAQPLGRVEFGQGNGNEPLDCANNINERFEGAVQDNIIATYMHGPALARNPELADLILTRATGLNLPDLQIEGVEQLRSERLRAGE